MMNRDNRPESEEFCTVYITTPDEDTAACLGEKLIELKLAACANILTPIHSIYRWDGAIQKDRESVLLLKTRQCLFSELAAQVKAGHPYACPCIVAWPIVDGSPPYLAWIRNETSP